jgi:hypothetical protein
MVEGANGAASDDDAVCWRVRDGAARRPPDRLALGVRKHVDRQHRCANWRAVTAAAFDPHVAGSACGGRATSCYAVTGAPHSASADHHTTGQYHPTDDYGDGDERAHTNPDSAAGCDAAAADL